MSLSALHKQSSEVMSVGGEVTEKLIIDGHKLPYHMDRVAEWEAGERIAPVTIDLALTRKCDAACKWCYAMLQENDRQVITKDVIDGFLEDSARMGVRAISLLSDGESLLSPVFAHTVCHGKELGLYMASGSNCHAFTKTKQEQALAALSYLRINCPAGTRDRYCDIMQVKPAFFDTVIQNIRDMVELKVRLNLEVTLGLQMVLMPEDADQILPFVALGKQLGVDYAVVKHCADDEQGNLGVNYGAYEGIKPLLEEAETYATDEFKVIIQWSKILTGGKRSYQRCYGPPFLIQISGSGLVAPCGDKFNDRYAKFHIGNICEKRWWDIWQSERYWEVMDYLRSEDFDAQAMCGPLCRQHKINEALDAHQRGIVPLQASDDVPQHVAFL